MRLSKTQLLDFHTIIIERYGGRMGIASSDILDDVLATPDKILFGFPCYLTPTAKIAALVYNLVRQQPFVSHNETTALLVLLYWCDNNGQQLAIPHAEIVRAIMPLYHAPDESTFHEWLQANLTPNDNLPF
jgi:prophage maintenance system killer protein